MDFFTHGKMDNGAFIQSIIFFCVNRNAMQIYLVLQHYKTKK